MNVLLQGVTGDKLRPLIDAWPIVRDTLKLPKFGCIYIVESAFFHENCTLYLDDQLTGLWRPVDGQSANVAQLIADLGVSDYAQNFANGIESDPNGYQNWRVTPADFGKIVAHAHAIAERQTVEAARNPDCVYPDELRAAIDAFEAVRSDSAALRGRSPKTALLEWLEAHKPELSASARERVATVSNWQREGGAPKTPGS